MAATNGAVKEQRQGDSLANLVTWAALAVFVGTTWSLALSGGFSNISWFTFHPLLQTLGLASFTYGILTLQPTATASSKLAGLDRHANAIFGLGFPLFLAGTTAIAYSKWSRGADHATTWHGTLGYWAIFYMMIQIFIGSATVWNDGAAFGGSARAKAMWKYHRFSGYILFPMLFYTAHLGGGWSSWGVKSAGPGLRFLAFTLAPLLIVIGVFARVRLSKMKGIF